MKLVCAQSDLSTHLSLVSRAVPSRPTHPVLANVLLRADEETQQVSLTAFDLSLGIRTTFAAEVETGGNVTLPAKLLNDIVTRLPEGPITIDAELAANQSEGIVAVLTSASGRYQVRGMGAEEYPELPMIENGEVTHLPGDALIEGLRGSLFATSPDETKQVLTGVHLTVQPDSLEFAATDGHRLAVVETTSQNADTEAEQQAAVGDATQLQVTVPARALRELERMLGVRQSTESVALHLDQGQVVFEWLDQRLTSRTLEGQYPAYRQLIPRSFERQITLERRSLLNAVERIAVLADQKNNIVKFSINSESQELALSVEAQDVGSGRESLPAEISGQSIDIAFNVKYLTDGLKALNTAEIKMQLNTANSPVILTPLGGLKLTYLIMPVQIRA
jgi:DNA polymerase-3 subunit beta